MDRKLQVRWLALLAGAAISLYGCWLLLRPFLGILTWAVVLVVTFYPMHRRIVAWTGRPGWSALISSALVVAVILVPVSLVVLMVLHEVPNMVQNTRDAFAHMLGPETPLGERTRAWLEENIGLERLRSPEVLLNWVQKFIDLLGGSLFGVVGGLIGMTVQAFFVIFTVYYLFRDGTALVSWLRQVLPMEEVQNAEILRRTREMIEASVYGVMMVAVLQGTLGGLAFLVLGIPSALVWGAVMIILSVIPVTGAFVVWALAAIYLAATGEWGKAVLLTAWGTLVIGLIDNFLRPKLMGQRAKLHELVLFFAVLGGLTVFGVTGLVLGPVLVAIALGLIDVIRQADQPAQAIRCEPGLAEQTAQIADSVSDNKAR